MSEIGKLRKVVAAGYRDGAAVGSHEHLGELLEARGVHPLRQYTVLRYIALWGFFTAQMSREPRTVEELADALKIARRTAFRGQEAFRQAFPEYASPGALWAVVGDQVEPSSVSAVVAQLPGVTV